MLACGDRRGSKLRETVSGILITYRTNCHAGVDADYLLAVYLPAANTSRCPDPRTTANAKYECPKA
jgi:hypothetical protein